MLKKLLVRNYALIKELEINFDGGFTVLTGETGAGKSIILGALSLILGNRADSSTLLDKSDKCVVEGFFNIENEAISNFLRERDIDSADPLILRREVTPNGRSRAFINDTPVNLDIMKELADWLIDIHSQHESLLLGSKQFQLSLIDSFANHDKLLDDYRSVYDEYKRLEWEYRTLSGDRDKRMADLDYYSFQLRQLDDARLQEGEEKELESEQELLTHAGEINEALVNSSNLISGDEYSALNHLNEVRRLLEKIVTFYPAAETLIQRIESTIIELNDVGNELNSRAFGIENDPSRLETVTERLDILNSLMQKHRADDVKSLIEIREEIRSAVTGIETSDERLTELAGMLDKRRTRLNDLANKITENRSFNIPSIEEKMRSLLVQLGIPNGRFEIKMIQESNFSEYGRDHAEFLFSANKQVLPENIAKVASGGELSRVMLSLKSLLTDNESLPTIFFDEIDSGVSGDVATKVGNILASMGKRMQVINITHLPQVAAHGTMHYHVYKQEDGDSTITRIKLLNEKERLTEVARLLSGNEITQAALDNARELIESA
ncbi:MAG: DNA repair protein RecN [Bacteroidales bacterium]|jgi:DNA repair protein RecN (Recombination protein N)|nr:DNA repair protein RecN [Bacteroidales bacterium]